jgi:DNA-binding NarL/FixJ family response regulator
MRILIADDHSLFRDGLRSLLTAHGHHVVGEAQEGREAVELVRSLKPDLVLMDLAMSGLDGLAATRLISTELPDVKVVVLTASEEDAKPFEAIKAGAQGYLVKNLGSTEFMTLLEGLERGEPALTPGLAKRLLKELAHPTHPGGGQRGPDALTDREREVLELLVRGITSNRKLAKHLGLSESTVKFHIRNVLDKLHVSNRAEAVGLALRQGIVRLPDEPST